MAETRGIVYLVGAGPGDPGLLTRRGEALLRMADVVVYDRLVSDEIMGLCSASAQLEYVGKKPGAPSLRQDEINRKLIDCARDGRRVVRLKGGDPFVFGRGGEESLALREAGIPFEIVPGVSSAIAAPAYAGIPVTHRGLASSVTIATGHEDPTKGDSALNWFDLACGSETLVFLMGVEKLTAIADRLIAAGRSPGDAAALIRWGTTAEQETLTAELGSIGRLAQERGFKPPAVLVVGAVVGLADRLAWFDRRPLHGRRVLVTRAREQASALSARLRSLGARVLEFPTIRIAQVESTEHLDAVLARASDFEWVVFTSANGVRAVFGRLSARLRDARTFGAAKIAAIGPATAAALSEHGLRADFVPTTYTSDAIAAELLPLVSAGASVLLLRTDIAPPALFEQLARAGVKVENVAAYRTLPDTERQAEMERLLLAGGIDVVTFTSSSTVSNLVAALNGHVNLLERTFVACIGPITAATARQLGVRVDLEAEVHTIDGLVDALVASLRGEPDLDEVNA